MTKYVAFLRSINVGKRRVKMDVLRRVFVNAGFEDAETFIASGNVFFSSPDATNIAQTIEAALHEGLGFEVDVFIRSIDELETMIASDPFRGAPSSSNAKNYVYFFGSSALKHKLPLEIEGDYCVIKQTSTELFAIAYRMDNGRFGAGLDKFSKGLPSPNTNRNWNTIVSLVEKVHQS
jgi:uncharacterized protein (DUF1697 family)